MLFHDAVRPLIDPRIITDCVAALSSYAAVDVAIPSADTVITVDEAGRITTIPPRERLRRGQTPQGFRLSVIRRAYRARPRRPGLRGPSRHRRLRGGAPLPARYPDLRRAGQ